MVGMGRGKGENKSGVKSTGIQVYSATFPDELSSKIVVIEREQVSVNRKF